MNKYEIAVIVGSLRRDSFNRKLAFAMAKLAPSDFSFSQLNIGDLPLFNQDDDANPTESVRRLKSEITAARDCYWSPQNTTARSLAFSRTRSITPRARMDKTRGRASPQACWARRSA